VISTRFEEGYKRGPEDGELDPYERGLYSYWIRISQQRGNELASQNGREDARSPGRKRNEPQAVTDCELL
jgi:hypothetical protein